ncbi:MAG: shikimate kinase [Lachnospiraceae bacterium]|nr:shikimate kinase [Lachnospiraceae bacterium]
MKKLSGHIFLIGFMGVGKSAVASELSRKIEKTEIDTDKFIENALKMSIPEIFEKKGEAYFRTCESKILLRISQLSPRVVSCGGGFVMNEKNVKKMKRMGTIILLKASPETIYERLKDTDDRPLLKGNMNVEYISKLMSERMPIYESAADVIIETDGLTPNDVAQKIDRLV